MQLRHSFSPPDNARLAHLCGPLDEHLRSIEAAFGVTLSRRGEQFRRILVEFTAQQRVAGEFQFVWDFLIVVVGSAVFFALNVTIAASLLAVTMIQGRFR